VRKTPPWAKSHKDGRASVTAPRVVVCLYFDFSKKNS
jgi:hypothetical protein